MSNSGRDSDKTLLISIADGTSPQGPVHGTVPSESRFTIVKALGQGGMGEVFLGIDTHDPARQKLAIKTIFPGLMQDQEIVSRFASEAKLLSAIQHPNVVKLVEWGLMDQSGSHFMAMEYVDGISLHHLARRRRLTVPATIDLAIQIAKGLQATHQAQILHRDLKPGNVMITRDGVAKIIDFGIAKPAAMGLATDDDPERGFKTKTGVVIGTVNYIAPEILRGEPASEATDIYALGLMIWEMLNGQTPFKSKNLGETMARINGEMLLWSDAIFDIAPQGFTKLVAKLTAKDPKTRIGSAKQALEELEKLRSTASWVGSFGRKTRYDLDIQWADETLERIKAMDVKEPDIGFVLQELEERLLERQDLRLANSQPLEIEVDQVKRAVNAFKSSRYKSAMSKTSRTNISVSTAIASPVAKDKDSSQTGKLAATLSSLVIFGLIAFFVIRQAQNRIRNIASDNISESRSLVDPASTESGDIEPVATLGSSLVYQVRTQTPNGTEVLTEQTRLLVQSTPTEISWLVNQRSTYKTPRALLPLETYFSETREKAQVLERAEFKTGAKIRVEFFDKMTNTTDDTRCTIISSRRQLVVTRTHEVWKIECLRRVSKSDRLIQRMIETYDFVPLLNVVLAGSFKTEDVDANGIVTSSELRRIELQLDFSKLSQSDPRLPSPW